jgi:glyoxylase-like metal-dependent hydrolase (beta-lactamase superfamily II)
MTLIEYFGLVVKPKITNGKFVFAPLNSQKIAENIYALRDKDVNAFIYKKGDNMIAIDCGYKNCQNISKALRKLRLNEGAVTDLFLTHLDLDHAGGVDVRCDRVYPNAKIHLGKVEEGYLKHRLFRKKLGFIGLKTPIRLENHYQLLDDGQVIMIGDIKIQAILVPGHTAGHICYLIDDRHLFSGDCLVLVKGMGYAFYSLWNVNTVLLSKSLLKLRNLSGVEMVITHHSGYTKNIDCAFKYIDQSPNWKAKGYKVSDDAPSNSFEE